MNPVTVESVRADWIEDPSIENEDLAALQELSDEVIQDALDAAFCTYEDMFYHVLDNTRMDATSALLEAAN